MWTTQRLNSRTFCANLERYLEDGHKNSNFKTKFSLISLNKLHLWLRKSLKVSIRTVIIDKTSFSEKNNTGKKLKTQNNIFNKFKDMIKNYELNFAKKTYDIQFFFSLKVNIKSIFYNDMDILNLH